MKRPSYLALVFAFLYLVFLILLIFFRFPFPLYPLMSWQDAVDLLTPLVLIPLYWLLFKAASSRSSGGGEEIWFMLLAVVWVLGHGMHLAANSLDNLIEGLAKKQELDVTGTVIYQLTYFMDEQLSHYLWHGGVVGLAILIIYRAWRAPGGAATLWWVTVLAGVIHGFTLFCMFNEGQTVPLGLPFTALVTLLTLVWGRKKLNDRPVLAFFVASCLLAFALLAGWGLYWGGFPEFSDVGLI